MNLGQWFIWVNVIYQRVKTNQIIYEEAGSKIKRFNGLIGILMTPIILIDPLSKGVIKKERMKS